MSQKIISFKFIYLLIRTVWICIYQYIKYKLRIIDLEKLIKNTVIKLSKINILYVKFFQWVINDTIYNDDELKKIFMNFTENVEYDKSDIDSTLVKSLKQNNIELEIHKPIKSGTISLVYKGSICVTDSSFLKSTQDYPDSKSVYINNKTVVIKIQKKNICHKLEESINYLNFLSYILKNIPYIKYYNIDEIVNANSKILLKQTNFENEISNMQKYYEYFKNNKHIRIPFVYETPVNKNNMIIMEYLEGKNAYDIDNIYDKKIYSELLYEFIFYSILKKNTIHGDLHPGNILFGKTIEDDKVIHNICILDYGIVYFFDNNLTTKTLYIFGFMSNRQYDNLFKYILLNCVDKITNNNEPDINNQDILNNMLKDLHEARNKYDFFGKKNKSDDIYHLNNVLRKYNLKLSLDISRVLISFSSMYSLLSILRDSDDIDIFKLSFNKFLLKEVTEIIKSRKHII